MDDNFCLDIDDINGCGLENINIFCFVLGIYWVGVHSFLGGGLYVIMVRIYCGGSDIMSR